MGSSMNWVVPIPLKLHVKPLIRSVMTVFGDRAYKKEIKVRWGHKIDVLKKRDIRELPSSVCAMNFALCEHTCQIIEEASEWNLPC
jgi:hypothetical protein